MDTDTLFDTEPELSPDGVDAAQRAALPVGDSIFYAQLVQQDRRSGLRGWKLYVAVPGNVADWPERVWSRQAAGRPPAIEARLAALAEMGFELADVGGRPPTDFDPGELWEWQEKANIDDTVGLFASARVRRITRTENADV